ncbi:BTAD domain-containing putative transcriptional regulator [Nonomuraea sp. NPDC049141]|uniref:AfsR/SARP family transcriptional regulator n=1 Tax=Nonomuraea sp. NPDC049141 TaxID=3155500 RepID=UPI0033EA9AD3
MIHFSVLGALRVSSAGAEIPLSGPKQRIALATLLLHANERVSADHLITRMWDGDESANARAALQTHLTRLRQALGAPGLIRTFDGSYTITATPDSLDLLRYREICRRSRRGEPAEELAALTEAMALCGEPLLANVPSEALHREEISLLVEEQLRTLERWSDLHLEWGRPEQGIAVLRAATARHPYSERLWANLIRALHRSGRQAEAMEAYQSVTHRLREDLDVRPGELLRRAHQSILTAGETEVVGASMTPQQLPSGVAHFTGRLAELDRLDRLVADVPGRTEIVVIGGPGGAGKSALAVHWAHQMIDRFPGGQLYLNLRGFGPGAPMEPMVAIETLLRAMGVSATSLSADLDARAAMLRSTLAGRRMLLLLDNARDSAQVRPLLPGANSLVLVTSRNQLRGLAARDGARQLTLDTLTGPESLELLEKVIGARQVADERDAAVRLVELCAGLPLALSVIAERAHRGGGLARIVSALEDEKARLEQFRIGEDDPLADLNTALLWSYRALTPPVARMFRLLGLHPTGDLSLEAAAALVGVPPWEANALLDQLVAAHLVKQVQPDRFELHDLVHLYATGRAMEEERAGERDAAVDRLLDWYLYTVVEADRQLLPHRVRDFVEPYTTEIPPLAFGDHRQATSWLEREYHCLRSVIACAAASGQAGHAWRISIAMTTFFDRYIPWHDGLEFARSALRAAEIAGEPAGQGYTLNSLGCVHFDMGDHPAALSCFERSLSHFQQAGHARGEAMVLGNIGLVHGELGDPAEGRRCLERALTLYERLGGQYGIAHLLDNLGTVSHLAGDHVLAVHYFRRALDAAALNGNTDVRGDVLSHLGRAYAALRDWRRALRSFREAVALYQGKGNRRWLATALTDLGQALADAGRREPARQVLQSALAEWKAMDDPRVGEVVAILETI